MPDDVQQTLNEILAQTRATNGRVTALEYDMKDVKDVLYGDDERKTTGLVAQSNDVAELLRQWQGLTSVLKWAATTFGVAAVGLLGNLVGAGL